MFLLEHLMELCDKQLFLYQQYRPCDLQVVCFFKITYLYTSASGFVVVYNTAFDPPFCVWKTAHGCYLCLNHQVFTQGGQAGAAQGLHCWQQEGHVCGLNS